MRRNKRKTTKMSLLMMLLLLGIGFAALTANLKINGTVDVSKASWDVHFENVSITEGSVTATTVPTSDDETTTEMTYAVNFTKPGDFYEFTVDIVNDGSIDAMVDLVTNKVYSSDGETEITLPNYLKSSVTYIDGSSMFQKQLLEKQTSEKIKVRVEFKRDINPSDLPSSADTMMFKFGVDYKQADDTAISRPTTFEDDDWDTIIANVKSGNISAYPVGSEKSITITGDFDEDGDSETQQMVLRVANNSMPSECSTPGFSQSACGFVLEFEELIYSRRISPYTNNGSNGDGNIGSWKYSEVRNYVNTIIYNSLPDNIKNNIIEVDVVTGRGNRDTEEYTTSDYLYLLSTKEVWGKEGTTNVINNDTADPYTRQLDYYKSQGVTTNSTDGTGAIKKAGSSNAGWWLRSPDNFYAYPYYYVKPNGNVGNNGISTYTYGIAPAFRIG